MNPSDDSRNPHAQNSPFRSLFLILFLIYRCLCIIQSAFLGLYSKFYPNPNTNPKPNPNPNTNPKPNPNRNFEISLKKKKLGVRMRTWRADSG